MVNGAVGSPLSDSAAQGARAATAVAPLQQEAPEDAEPSEAQDHDPAGQTENANSPGPTGMGRGDAGDQKSDA